MLSALLTILCLASPAKTLPPTPVTLRGSMPLSDALAAVQKQTGNPFVDLRPRLGQEAPDPPLQVSFDGAPFWQALDEIAAMANVRIFPFVDAKTRRPSVGIRGPDQMEAVQAPMLAYSGPFRIVVKRVLAVRDLEKASNSKLVITLQLACEPRYEPLLLRGEREAIRVRIAAGPAQVAEQVGLDKLKLLGEAAVELTLQVPLPPRSQVTLPELQCEFVALVHPQRLTLQMESLAGGASQEEKGVSVLIQRVDVDRRQQRSFIHVAVQYPAGRLDLESHQTWAAEGHEMVLRSKSGPRELRSTGNPVISVEERGPMRITYTLPEALVDPQDWRLSYRLPGVPVRVPVKFKLVNLPLP